MGVGNRPFFAWLRIIYANYAEINITPEIYELAEELYSGAYSSNFMERWGNPHYFSVGSKQDTSKVADRINALEALKQAQWFLEV